MGYQGDQKRAYQREWMNRRRQQWIEENGPCRICGSTMDLEVDHWERSEKSVNTRSLWGMSHENPKRIAELAKCQVLCHLCHEQKTRLEMQVPCWERRTERRGCGCGFCRQKHSARVRRWRERRKVDRVSN